MISHATYFLFRSISKIAKRRISYDSGVLNGLNLTVRGFIYSMIVLIPFLIFYCGDEGGELNLDVNKREASVIGIGDDNPKDGNLSPSPNSCCL